MPIAVCFDCANGNYGTKLPQPLPEDFVCEHWRPEYWVAKGYKRCWGDAAVMNWPWLEILRKEADGKAEYVILCPFGGRRPVQISGGLPSWGGY